MELLPENKNEYDKLLKQIKSQVKISSGDEHLLKMYVDYLLLYSAKRKIVFEGGDVVTYQTGARQLSPDYTIMRDCTDKLMKLSDKLLLNLSIRQRMKIEEIVEKNDPTDEL